MDSEYGCEHLGKVLADNEIRATQFRQKFLSVHQLCSSGSKKYVTPSKLQGISLLKPTYVCLTCEAVCSCAGRRTHFRETGHMFMLVFRTSNLWCQKCEDLIYDSNLDRHLFASAEEAKRKQREFSEDADEDAAFVAANSVKKPCAREGLRGIFNLGQTCYMSVILQALLHNSILTTYFLGNGHKAFDCTEDHCINCALSDAFAEFNNDEKADGIVSLSLLYYSWLSSPELAGCQQQDAHEFYQFLVDKLHCATLSNSQSKENCQDECRCFFHKAFFGKLRSTVTCLQCGNETKKDDPIMDLSLAFQAQQNGQLSGMTSRSLKGCLESFTAPERLTYICNHCGDIPQLATKQLQIGRLPLILCIQLKRFEHTPASTEKVHNRIDFPLSINMAPYTIHPRMNNSSRFIYDLTSVIVHTGTLDSGHYYSYCQQGENWYLFNDDRVTKARLSDVLNSNAYLLFYTVRTLVFPV